MQTKSSESVHVLVRVNRLKEKHNIEQQLEMLQKQKEQMDIDAKIAASNAKLSVLKDFEQGADSIVTDGMESYVNKQSKSTTVSLHPDVKKQPMTALESRKGVTSQPRASHHSQRNVSSRSRIPGSSDGGFDSTQNVLQKQREITELLIQHQKSHHLPPREIPVFEGDPLQFSLFTKAFKHCVEEKTNNKGDCLYFLERYTRGRPREIVRSCMI